MNEYLLVDFEPYEEVHDCHVGLWQEVKGLLPIQMQLSLYGGPTSVGKDVVCVDQPDTPVKLLAKVLDDLQGE